MKKLNILIAGLAMLGMSSCNDFLEVEAPSAFDDQTVFLDQAGAQRLLNGVYANLASDNTFGNAFINTFDLNSDVEYYTCGTEPTMMTATKNFPRQYVCTPDVSSLYSTWTAAYKTIESANNFVTAAESSALAADSAIMQLVGEAKCIRAMNYLELVILMGDVPFTLTRSVDADGLVMPIADRDVILTTLINDLRAAAPKMKFAADNAQGIERCSKEFAWALIAKMAMYRAGYSMRKGATAADKGEMKRAADYEEYYNIASNYCDSVIRFSGHSLTKDWYNVFIDECNYRVTNVDDPLFEIPFTMEVSGRIGDVHGPSCNASGTGTVHPWGKTNGGIRLNYFFRFTYDKEDVRRNAVGVWSYTDATPAPKPTLLKGQNAFCNKWSKFFDYAHRQGAESDAKTGINFPYIRLADVLLMYAEAENELHGPTADAKAALKQVRDRAFRGASNYGEMVNTYVDAATTKEAFFDLIFKERAWEFAGEGLRWKDLVRWNLLSKVAYQQFFKYFGYAIDPSYDIYDEFDSYPTTVYYKVVSNPNLGAESYVGGFPNNTFDVLKFFDYIDNVTAEYVDTQWEAAQYAHVDEAAKPSITGSDPWTMDSWGAWEDSNTGTAVTGARLGFCGYIYADQYGALKSDVIQGNPDDIFTSQAWDNLPALRYILPIPQEAIARSEGQYRNYYGY